MRGFICDTFRFVMCFEASGTFLLYSSGTGRRMPSLTSTCWGSTTGSASCSSTGGSGSVIVLSSSWETICRGSEGGQPEDPGKLFAEAGGGLEVAEVGPGHGERG